MASKVQKFSKKTDIEHVLTRPAPYIGNMDREKREIHILREGQERCELVSLDLPVALVQVMIKETLGNACDQILFSKENGHKNIGISVTMDNKWIEITNEGEIIPIKLWEEEDGTVSDRYIAEILFGNLRTSSNYDDENEEKTSIGTNGIGAKAVNIFSREFIVSIYDADNHQKYTQHFSNNMRTIDPPEITRYTGKKSQVSIKYRLDMRRFGYEQIEQDMIDLFRRYCVDTSYNCGVRISFNGHVFDIPPHNIALHASYYVDLKEHNYILHYKWHEGITFKTTREGLEYDPEGSIPYMRLISIDTPYEAFTLGFTNSVWNPQGGRHIKDAMDGVASKIIATLNSGNGRKTVMTKAPAAAKKPTTNAAQLKITDVKKHVSIIVSVRINKPSWSSQNKDKLNGCADAAKVLSVTLDPKKLKNVFNWNFVAVLREILQANSMNKLNNMNKKTLMPTGGHEKANDAGKAWPKSKNTILFLTEGKSASGYITAMISKAGRDKNGSLPLRGKPVNGLEMSFEDLLGGMDSDGKPKGGNKEIQAIVNALGLQYGVDYSDDKKFQALNYNYVVLATDNDKDAIHIIMLFVAFFYHFWPSLFRRFFLSRLITPIYRVYPKAAGRDKISKMLNFFDEESFIEWSAGKTAGYEIKYCKGLGSSSSAEAKADYDDPRQMFLVPDRESEESINISMHGKYINERKQWLTDCPYSEDNEMYELICDKVQGINAEKAIYYYKTVTGFVNSDHLDFSRFNLNRSTPFITDGLKPSERKIIYTALLHFKYGTVTKPINIAAFAGKVVTDTDYHHGETSLHDSIGRFATTYVCKNMNNLPLLTANSIIGDRNNGSEAIAKARYANIRMPKWAKSCFLEVDMKILPRNRQGQEELEPEFLLPVVPLVLINGAIGIGTGWSSNIPNYATPDVVDHLRWKIERLLEGKNYTSGMRYTDDHLDLHRGPSVRPFYRNFKGDVKIILNKTRGSTEGKLAIRTEGVHEYDYHGKRVDIKELPVDMIASKYREKIIYKFLQNKSIKEYKDNSDDVHMNFSLIGANHELFPSGRINSDTLKLVSSMTMNNMHLMDLEGRCKHYPSAYHIMDDFFDIRLHWYGVRKDYMAGELQKEIKNCNDRIRFIRAVLSHYFSIKKDSNTDEEQYFVDNYLPIRTMRVGKAEVERQMKEYDPPIPIIHARMGHHNFTIEMIHDLEEIIRKKELEYTNLMETHPAVLWRNDLDKFEEAVRREGFYVRDDKTSRMNFDCHVDDDDDEPDDVVSEQDYYSSGEDDM